MSTQIKTRRGTAAEHSTFTGAEGELTVNTTNNTVHVHDGATAGGHELAKETEKVSKSGDTMTGNLNFGDNDKAQFGAGNDLQIYHDGLNSYISEEGTGSLAIRAEDLVFQNSDSSKNYARGLNGGAFELNHNGIKKLATTSTGVDVTGTVTADGLTVDASTVDMLELNHSIPADAVTIGQDSSGDFRIRNGGTNRLKSFANGDFELYEDTGTTPKFFWDASDEALRIGSSEWPTSYVGKSANRHGMVADGEPILLLWDASTGAQGNKSQIMIGGKPTNSATRFAGGRIEGGVENATDDDGYLAFDVSVGNSGFTERMRIDSSGNVGIGTSSPTSKLDVTGTVTADGLTVDNGSVDITQVAGTSSTMPLLTWRNTNGSGYDLAEIQVKTGPNIYDGSMQLRTQRSGFANTLVDRINIDNTGDISFYEDTGTTPKFFWDASAESLGIGTGSPASRLHVETASGTDAITISRPTYGEAGVIREAGGALAIESQKDLTLEADVDGVFTGASSNIVMKIDGSEKMRIDSSGNLLVGTTTTDRTTDDGITASASGFLDSSRTSDIVGRFTRRGTDGEIVRFRKDGSTVGSIGTAGGDLLVYPTDSAHKGLRFGSGNIRPTNNSGTVEDNTTNLGSSTYRFKDLYLSGGVYLGGTGSANHLDDYEEGTWTPTVGGTWTTNPTNLSGTYVKVGRLVFVQATWIGGAKASSTSGWIGGLPAAIDITINSVGSASDSNVDDRGNALFANTDRMWLTATSFGSGANYASGTYYTNS